MLLRLPYIKSNLFFQDLCLLFGSSWVTGITTGTVTRNPKSLICCKLLECFLGLSQNCLLFILLSHHKVNRNFFFSQQHCFRLRRLKRILFDNTKTPLWDTGLLLTQRVCLGQTWRDCAWLTKPSNSNSKITCLYSYYLFNVFICVQFCELDGSCLYWSWIQTSLCFLAYNFPKQVPVWPNFLRKCQSKDT